MIYDVNVQAKRISPSKIELSFFAEEVIPLRLFGLNDIRIQLIHDKVYKLENYQIVVDAQSGKITLHLPKELHRKKGIEVHCILSNNWENRHICGEVLV